MKLQQLIPLLILFAIITACASPSVEQSAPIAEQPEQASRTSPVWEQNAIMDEQGAVVVEVTPLNLNTQDNTLQFEIALNTHSVDLGMDLSSLATLSTDTGKIVQATDWDAPRGGHHVSGKLFFPSTVEGNSILEGATQIKLQIRNVDAELREFEWYMQ
jgi:hypothetical protein